MEIWIPYTPLFISVHRAWLSLGVQHTASDQPVCLPACLVVSTPLWLWFAMSTCLSAPVITDVMMYNVSSNKHRWFLEDLERTPGWPFSHMDMVWVLRLNWFWSAGASRKEFVRVDVSPLAQNVSLSCHPLHLVHGPLLTSTLHCLQGSLTGFLVYTSYLGIKFVSRNSLNLDFSP